MGKPGPRAADDFHVLAPLQKAAGRRGALDVLVVEEDPQHCRIIRQCLDAPGREHIRIDFVHTVKDAVEALRRARYNCVMIGHELPDGCGLDVLEEFDEELLTTPVIGLTSGEDPAVAREYFRAGCVDFFLKNEILDTDRLRRAIARAMARFHRRAMGTIIERRELGNAVIKSQEGLIALARTDRLMGICNRAVFDDYFSMLHAEAAGRQGTYGLCMVDVDNFKRYNDQYGHAAGDEALRAVAQALTSTLRENDFIARYGGEEIAVLLDEIDADNAARVADRLRRLVYDLNLPHSGNAPYGRVTVSIGVANVGIGIPEAPQDVLLRADEALYKAKNAGRNMVVVAPLSKLADRLSA